MAAKKAAATPQRGRPKGMPRTNAEIAADAKRTGRPLVASDQAVSKGVTMRLTPAEHTRFTKDAKRLKMGLSEYLRYCWQTAREGKKYGKTVSQSGSADKSGNRKIHFRFWRECEDGAGACPSCDAGNDDECLRSGA